MALNPNIALQVRGLELQNPIAQYGQIAQLQNAQNQNALAQYQLGAAQRAEAKDIARTNALASAGTDDAAIGNALLKSGDLKGYADFQKARRETEKADVDLVDAKLKQSRFFLENVNTPEQYIAWHEANHKDPIIGRILAARGITADQSRARIMAAIQTPDGFQRLLNESKLGTEKFMEMNKDQTFAQDTGAGGRVISRPGLGGSATVVPGSEYTKTKTFGDITAEGNLQVAQKNLGVSQSRLNLDRQKFAFEQANPGFELKEGEDGTFYGVNKRTLQAVPVNVGAPAAAGAAPAAGPAGATPVAATPLKGKGTALTESQGNATAFGMRMMESNKILTDLEKLGKKDTGVIKGAVGATVGLIPFLGDKLEDMSGSVFNALPSVLGGLSPEQQQVAQARINFITALLRKESGAAIGASEFATAEKNYFPKPGDDAKTIAQKQQARETAIKAMQVQAGPGAKQMGGGVPGASANNPLGLPGL
jgi:hypothetical protein